MSTRPLVSIVLATHNRRDIVCNTVAQIADCGLQPHDYEIIVVDNASTDGTPEALHNLPGLAVRRLDQNLGSCAKALGVEQARGPIVLFLDDDSFPRPGCLGRMLAHFDADPGLGAAGFTVHLPDGSQECSALPHVFVGCGVGFRARALSEVGGLDLSFFMQAEEYDLSFRLLQAGWRVEVFHDLQVSHGKSPTARRSERATSYDVCNNLRVIARYLPEPAADVYRADWLQRYAWLAESLGHADAFQAGLHLGRRHARSDRLTHRHWRLSPRVFEQVFCWSRIQQRMADLYCRGVRRIVLADLGKNVYAFHRGAAAAGLRVLAIADDRLSAPGRTYRGTPVVPADQALTRGAHALVISNTSYVHAHQRWLDLSGHTSRSVHNWFEPPADGGCPALDRWCRSRTTPVAPSVSGCRSGRTPR